MCVQSTIWSRSLIFPPPNYQHTLCCFNSTHLHETSTADKSMAEQYCIVYTSLCIYPDLISKRELEFKTQFAAIRWAVIYGCKRSWRGDLVTPGSLRPGPPTQREQPKTMVEIVPRLSALERWCKRHFKDGSFERVPPLFSRSSFS